MANFELEDTGLEQKAKIKVIGAGGAGGNAVNAMIERGLQGVEFIVANTDSQDLRKSLAHTKIQIGNRTTKGLGSGGNPNLGREAAIEDQIKIAEALEGADMVFITAGMGGGT
ncbi:MAG: cell division protein FtsZ, partial [Candidatus Dadabacteria bacterium]|nr:cell division protein FtsZ [Candidatus Dadabacteria bacterium]